MGQGYKGTGSVCNASGALTWTVFCVVKGDGVTNQPDYNQSVHELGEYSHYKVGAY